jgi:hypothetical protein
MKPTLTPTPSPWRGKILRRGPWENASSVVIGVGIAMLMQPFAIELYTWSFAVILAGTVGFLVTSHFPE